MSRINLNFFSEKVKRMAGVKNVVAITSAKVPIIKLFHTQVIMSIIHIKCIPITTLTVPGPH